MNLKSTGTVGDLQIEMAGYRDAGVAMQIQAAINKLINLREINQKMNYPLMFSGKYTKK